VIVYNREFVFHSQIMPACLPAYQSVNLSICERLS